MSSQTLHWAVLVGAVYRRPCRAYWVVLLCDDSERVVVTAVLTWDHSLVAVTTRVLSHFTSTSIFTAAKGTSNATSSLSRIKVVVEVSQLTDPLTPFLVIRAAYFETFYYSLKIFLASCVVEHVRFAARGTLCFAGVKQTVTTFSAAKVSTVSDEWFCKLPSEQLIANRALVVDICFVY